MSTQTLNLSLPQELVKLLDAQAKQEMTTRSGIMRRAALEYLRNNPQDVWSAMSAKTGRLARKAGVKTEQDVVKLTKKVRQEIVAERSRAQD